MVSRFEQFTYVISGIHRYIQKLQRTEMVKYGYKGAYAQYLVAIYRHPQGVTSARLCEICDKDKAAVSRIVCEMEERGLIYREFAGERYYNAKLKLTQDGQKAAEFVHQRARAAIVAIDNQMSDEERRAFYSTLDFISDKLQLLSKEGIPSQSEK